MWRMLFLAMMLAATPLMAAAEVLGPWEVCRGAAGPSGPLLSDCRPLAGKIDPQGRELWIRAPAPPRPERPQAIYVSGAASSEVWFNGVRIGANGRPAPTAAAERPGLYDFKAHIPDSAWREQGNEVVVRLSSFHVGIRFADPIGTIQIGSATGAFNRLPLLAVTFLAAGTLLAAFFGFGAIHVMRRTGSSLTLAAMSGVAALQAGAETLRSLVRYDYPLHLWRVGAIWALSAAFALLLVAYAGGRFLPRWRTPLLGAALVAVAASAFLPGFDEKSGAALLAGAVLAGVAAAVGAGRQRPGAWPLLAGLAAFVAAAFVSPYLFLDLSVFLLAAGLTLPLLVAEVVRLGRDDRDREAALTRAASRPDRLTVATARGVELTPLRDIVAILGADDYAELRLQGGRSLLHAARLERLETQLPVGFVRVHRSVIANLAHVERLEREGGRWRLHMSEGAALPVSRSRLAALREALDEPNVPLRAATA